MSGINSVSAGNIPRTGRIRNVYVIIQTEDLLGRPGHGKKDNININFHRQFFEVTEGVTVFGY
jgi:hypothetical protein